MTPQRGQLVSDTDVDYFVLDLPRPGLVFIESQSSINTRGRLFDADETLLTRDDHSGRRQNFRLGSAVEKGVHYLAVDSLSDATGSYTLTLDYRPGYLEIPWAESTQSGISVLSGWICEADEVVIEIETGSAVQSFEAAYGTEREPAVVDICGDNDNGYGLLFNWNNLGAGAHTVRAVIDGVVLAEYPITVVTLGAEPFRRGLSGTYALEDFPQVGETTQVVWSEGQQNFVIATGESPAPTGDMAGVPRSGRLEIPGSGSYQSGVGVISGWVCEAETVEVVITPETGAPLQLETAYGTERADTREPCGDVDNGFGLLFNWNRLGDGVHTVELLVDGEAVAQSTIRVTTLGEEFVRGLRGRYTLEGFPTEEERVTIEWQQNRQNFGIVDRQ